MKGKAVVLLSGGQDSTTVLALAVKERGWDNVLALSVFYGQRHEAELQAAAKVAAMAGVRHAVVSLPEVLLGSSPLVNQEVELGQYASAADLPGGTEPTFVPGRNLLFLAVAANRMAAWGADTVYLGVSQEDYGGYPDCRETFLDAVEEAMAAALDRRVSVVAPLLRLTKKATVELAVELGCLSWMASTHTCYAGKRPPCGKCHACILRARGFEEAGVVDPLTADC